MVQTLALVVFLLCSGLRCALSQDAYETTIQVGLHHLYSSEYSEAEFEFSKLNAIHPKFPAPLVYQELVDSWKVAEDPENSTLVAKFHDDADAAIGACLDWTRLYPQDAEGWRYLSSAYGQASQFEITADTGFLAAVKSMRLGLKMHDAALKAYALDATDPDILLGLGSYDYFAAKVPSIVRPFARLFTSPGDRTRGIARIQSTIDHGRHMRTEAAMVLASAYWSEGDYLTFHETIERNVAARYPSLLPARTWEISGLVCNGDLQGAIKLANSIDAPGSWKDFQLGRILLAIGKPAGQIADRKAIEEADKHFAKSIEESGANLSIARWAYEGRNRAHRLLGADDIDVPASLSVRNHQLSERMFRPPHGCPH